MTFSKVGHPKPPQLPLNDATAYHPPNLDINHITHKTLDISHITHLDINHITHQTWIGY